MRLKHIVLTGYKTFATKTRFEFGEGITAVIGPNGSGKSNVADAIRWALGEQAFSLLRSKRTDDMIFAGSPKRARASMAEVLLSFDNSDGFFPVDVQITFENGDTVTEHWDGAARWLEYAYTRPSKVRSAVIDPNQQLRLNVNHTNNSRTLTPRANAAARKWTLKWIVWLQDALVTWGLFA